MFQKFILLVEQKQYLKFKKLHFREIKQLFVLFLHKLKTRNFKFRLFLINMKNIKLKDSFGRKNFIFL